MSSLTDTEKRYLEKLLSMAGGYVLDYTNATFDDLFKRHGIEIHSQKYQIHGTSKAKKIRYFWKCEPDILVAKVLSEILDSYETDCSLNNLKVNTNILEKSRDIVARLSGEVISKNPLQSDDGFLQNDFVIPNIRKLPIEEQAIPIIERRLEEVGRALGAQAYLSVIFLCGSILEAVLLGAAQKEPSKFNKASCSPKLNDGSVKKFNEWSLSQFIDVACEVGLLKPDVKKFSHGLRDFRNYIHPYQEMASGFTPDEHTARLCFQVLKAALASVAGERK